MLLSSKDPLVSILAVCYNHSAYLEYTLDSIKNQTYKNIDLVIIDDCSTDDSPSKIESWISENNYKCRFIRHSVNIGLTKTLNEGIRAVRGEYLQFISCDDMLELCKTEIQLQVLKDLPDEFAAVYSDSFLMDENSTVLKETKLSTYIDKINYSTDILDNIIELGFTYIPGNTVLYRTKCFHSIGFFNENYTFEDREFWLRYSLAGYKIKFIDKSLAYYRILNTSLTRNINTALLDSSLKIWQSSIRYKRHLKEKIVKNILFDIKRAINNNIKLNVYWYLKAFFYTYEIKYLKILLRRRKI